jgi:hypothetical protein
VILGVVISLLKHTTARESRPRQKIEEREGDIKAAEENRVAGKIGLMMHDRNHSLTNAEKSV